MENYFLWLTLRFFFLIKIANIFNYCNLLCSVRSGCRRILPFTISSPLQVLIKFDFFSISLASSSIYLISLGRLCVVFLSFQYIAIADLKKKKNECTKLTSLHCCPSVNVSSSILTVPYYCSPLPNRVRFSKYVNGHSHVMNFIYEKA